MPTLDESKQLHEKNKAMYKELLEKKDVRINDIKNKCEADIEAYKNTTPRPECKMDENKFKKINSDLAKANLKLQHKYKRSMGKIFFISLAIAVGIYILLAIINSLEGVDLFEDSTEGMIMQIAFSVIIPFFIFVISGIKRASIKATIKRCMKNKEYVAYLNAVDSWESKITEIRNEAEKQIKEINNEIDEQRKKLLNGLTANTEEKTPPKIIILGDDPGLSTGAVGYITLDNGKEILVPYSDSPQEYNVPSGSHHVLITADPKSSPMYHMTAKLDKEINFGQNNILWVDIRSTMENTSINWKLITREEFVKNIPSVVRNSIIKKGNL